jgi:hypothetical protein
LIEYSYQQGASSFSTKFVKLCAQFFVWAAVFYSILSSCSFPPFSLWILEEPSSSGAVIIVGDYLEVRYTLWMTTYSQYEQFLVVIRVDLVLSSFKKTPTKPHPSRDS